MNLSDPRIDEGIRLFNDREFFACHDVIEDYWTELTCPDRLFFQGLIQAAVALFHFEGRNFGGAIRLYRSSRLLISGYVPTFAGIDVLQFVEDMDRCFAELAQPHTGYPDHLQLDFDLVPTIRRQLENGSAGEDSVR